MSDIERRIYSPYAFTLDEREKARCNRSIYNELIGKYKVYRNDTRLKLVDGEDCNFAEYDVVIGRKPGYNHSTYQIHKNAPGLSMKELALLCDMGSLCFGYGMQGSLIRVSED